MKVFLSISCVLTLVPLIVLADTFEFLTYTPPAGWTKQQTADGIIYRRPTGVGLISLYSSRPASGTAEQEFAAMWRERIEGPTSIKAPQPKLETDGRYTVAVGGQSVNAQGTPTALTLSTIVVKGRVVGVSTVSAGDDVMREINAFLDSIDSASSAPQTAAGSNTLEVDFDVPPGYTIKREGGVVMLQPNAITEKTPCVYGFIPTRASVGTLDADAKNSLVQAFPGWQIKSEHYNAMRGIAADGWQYYWFKTDIQRLVGNSYEYATAMTMAFPGGPGHVNIVWGFGSTARCLADDVSFSRLFHSLRPRGWTPDGGKAFTKELVGTWRNTEAVGMAQYRFSPNGRYEYGQGTSTTFGTQETRTGSVGDGSYSLRGPALTLTGGRRAGRYFVRLYDDFSAGMWLKTISILNDNASTPLEVRYLRVKDLYRNATRL